MVTLDHAQKSTKIVPMDNRYRIQLSSMQPLLVMSVWNQQSTSKQWRRNLAKYFNLEKSIQSDSSLKTKISSFLCTSVLDVQDLHCQRRKNEPGRRLCRSCSATPPNSSHHLTRVQGLRVNQRSNHQKSFLHINMKNYRQQKSVSDLSLVHKRYICPSFD